MVVRLSLLHSPTFFVVLKRSAIDGDLSSCAYGFVEAGTSKSPSHYTKIL